MKLSIFKTWLNKRSGFFSLLVILLWLKSCLTYLLAFNLGIESVWQYFILFFNPIATTLFLLSFALYIKRTKTMYIVLLTISFLATLLLFSNVVYYREFSDYITISTILGSGKVSSGLGESALRLFRFTDILYWIDFLILIPLLITKKIKMDPKPIPYRNTAAITSLSILFFLLNLSMAEADRPELLKRTFSRDHIVKYLGIDAFTVYDAVQTYQAHQNRSQASKSDLIQVEKYVKNHEAKPNPKYFGIAKGRNVIYIHLESTQQFLIDYKLKDKNGVTHEVTPFLNQLYHDKSTYSFANFFHQVKSGKTSDAETLLENSFFGLTQGPLFTQLGDKNTFQAAPAILAQKQHYTSAVFHGNAGSFWNRNETYKRFGYQYFFDSSYYNVTPENSFQYGLHDKTFFQQSVQYLEHLQQPFYAKFITVSNHYPYSEFKNNEAGFPLANTKDPTINGYFATANYMDTAVKEFFDCLKASGLYDNSIIILYGDHYGISNTRNKDLAELVGKDKKTWNDLDNVNMQRVPMMFHIPGVTNGFVSKTYGGQVDVLPTLLHLLGISTDDYIQLGQDLFSKDHQQLVAFRNGNFVSPKYTIIGDTIYNTKTQQLIEQPDEKVKAEVEKLQKAVNLQLNASDQLTNGDLLRYANTGLKPVDPSKYNYQNQLQKLKKIEKKKGADSTSLYSENQQKSTVDLYHTKSYQEYHSSK